MQNLPRTKSIRNKYLAQRIMESKIALAIILFFILMLWTCRVFAIVTQPKPTPKIKINQIKVEDKLTSDYPYMILIKTFDK